MWSRKELKNRAKDILRKTYWRALVVSIVIAITGGNDAWSGGGNGRSNYKDFKNHTYSNFHYSDFIDWHFILVFASIFLIVSVLILAFRIFVGYSLEVGGKRFFTQASQYGDDRICLGFGFNGENYKGIVKTMLVTNIFIFLWTLLLIIPGIIKAYAYRMVPYILSDNPNIGTEEAIALSNKMTMGHKWDMFVLDLSFIGWYILGSLLCGIGVFFVMPYSNATNAELYLVLRRNALENNWCSRRDLLLDDANNTW
ncbi:DUF975 family protein [Clostridium cellulovorans]|uniref:Integral membrane protein n=1 Tax=Clostridium cellulovorans (strain ATCC 35296 / DSM 3052 / OCM 3 / 743B) TaxID=573061 RepID=D9ST81_CLOC7|nr:DUF975 family protein [Clostridium cellulovorans]ADL50697.1 protein of unknown function DUF975 [Clostridium cellulovorans 743B]